MNNDSKKDDLEFVRHIIEAIKLIETYLKNVKKEEFIGNPEKRDAVIRELTVIGEAAKSISDPFRSKNPSIEWKDLAAVRDIVVHQYFKIDLDIVWDTVKNNLPTLKKKLEQIMP